MLNENDLKCIEEQFSDVIQKNEYFVKTKQWIVCKFDVDTKPIAIYHNSGKLCTKLYDTEEAASAKLPKKPKRELKWHYD